MPETKEKRNGNGWREPRLLLQIATLLVFVVLAWAGLKSAVEGHTKSSILVQDNMQKQIETKVDQKQYDECMKNVERTYENIKEDIGEIRQQQTRIEDKVDQILLK